MEEKISVNWKKQKEYMEKATELLKERYPDRVPLAHVHSYGCQQNISDGEKIKSMLADMGYGFTQNTDDADIIIYNTCAVREHAEDRVFGNAGALQHNKRRKKDMLIGLCGCMMQQDHIVKKIKDSYPHVDMVFGTHALYTLPEILFGALKSSKRIFDIREGDGRIVEEVESLRDGEIKAFVPVMYGCDNFCSYCIVPYVRGRERSRSSEEIVKEVECLVRKGYKEIMLLGQNVNSYGKNLPEDINFSGLLRKINDIPGDFRIRFMSSHPKDATRELIDTIRDCEKVCNQLHLPVQSGSDDVLSRMNRKYDREKYLSLIDYAKKTIPDMAFSSDIIVGFPNETREDFEDTLSLIKNVRYDMLFTFIYSKRKGTRAADMEDFTPSEEKSARLRELLSIQSEISESNNKEKIGRVMRVLAEEEGKSGKEYLMGRTEGNITVEFKADRKYIGQFVDVKITGAKNWALLGEKV